MQRRDAAVTSVAEAARLWTRCGCGFACEVGRRLNQVDAVVRGVRCP